MDKYQNALNQINFAEKAEKSLKEFSTWIFGLSIGISSILLFQFDSFDYSKFNYAKIVYKFIVGYSMVTIFFSGLSKYLILNRENRKAVSYGILLKLLIRQSKMESDEFDNEWGKVYRDWVNEHNKLELMSKGLNIAIVLTIVLILTTAIFILSLI